MENAEFWKDFGEVTEMLKQAFVQMPGGQAKQDQDPAAVGAVGGMPPVDPAMAAAGGMPTVDPAMTATGGMPPVDPAMMAGGMPPVDPAMMAGGLAPDPAAAGAAAPEAAPGSPMITISLDQLFEIIQKVLGLAKKVGANGQGVQAPADQASGGLTADQLKATIYEAMAGMNGGAVA